MEPMSTGRVSFEDTVRAGMNLVTGEEFHKNFVTVAAMASENLARTLGPYAHTTLIDDGSSIYSTKDGWNIINRLQFGDGLQNALYGLMKDISFHLVATVGDGTTTAIVASNAMIQMLSSPEYKDLLQKSRQRDVLKSMHRVKDAIQKKLESPKYLHRVSSENDFEDIYKIAMISSNENEEVSDIIREIYCKTKNPNIHVNLGSGRSIDYEIQIGYRLDCKPKNINAYINHDGNQFMMKNMRTLFFNHNITFSEHRDIINSIIEFTHENPNTYVAIVAPHFDDIIMGAFAQDINQYIRAGQIPTVLPIQIGMAREIQKNLFEDAAMISKSTIFGAEALKKVEDLLYPRDPETGRPKDLDSMERAQNLHMVKEIVVSHLGFVPSFIATDGYILFEEYDQESPIFVNTLKAVKEAYDEIQKKSSKDMSPLNKEFMDISTRYTKLTGAMGIINIGAESELEQRCLKDSIDDAVLACRSAYLNGYVAGMNIATIGAALDVYGDDELNSMDHQIAKLISEVFRHVTYEVMRNKYPDADPVKDQVWTVAQYQDGSETKEVKETADHIINTCIRDNIGYDIVNEKFSREDLIVINSIKTDVEIIGAMMSIVTHALTSNQMLSLNRKFDKEIGKRMIRENDLEKYGTIAEAIVSEINKEGLKINNSGSVITIPPANPSYPPNTPNTPQTVPSYPWITPLPVYCGDSTGKKPIQDGLGITVSATNECFKEDKGE